MIRRLSVSVVVVCCTILVGCHQKVTENGSSVYSFQLWVPVLVAVAGIAIIPIGIVLFVRKQRFWGVCLIIAGPLVTGALAPVMYQDRAVVNDEGFDSRHGFWWAPIQHHVRYDDLRSVNLVVEEKTGRRGKTYSYFFDCTFKSGQTERLPLGDIMREALPEIADQFRKHNVPVSIPPNLPD